MKKNLNVLLSFETFFEIFKSINALVSQNRYHFTDVHFHVGEGQELILPYGHFRIRTSLKELESLKNEAVVVEPFGEAADKTGLTEYVVVVLNIRNQSGKYGIILQKRGELGSLTNDRMQIDLDIDRMTNVILLCPMNVSTNGHKIFETQYGFDNPIYTKDDKVYFSYNMWNEVTDDTRD